MFRVLKVAMIKAPKNTGSVDVYEVAVGCQTMFYASKQALIADFEKYVTDPDAFEKEVVGSFIPQERPIAYARSHKYTAAQCDAATIYAEALASNVS